MRSLPHITNVIPDGDLLRVQGVCPMTKKAWELEVWKTSFDMWRAGGLIQECFPDLSVDERELLQTGYTPEGWDQLWRDER